MSISIIVRKGPSHRGFVPHFNRSLDRRFYTKDDYLGYLKTHGLEPQDKSKMSRSFEKKLEPSKDAREVVNCIRRGRGKEAVPKFCKEKKFDFGQLEHARRMAGELTRKGKDGWA